MAEMLYRIFKKVWERKKMPKDWRIGLIAKILKKGYTANCNNWRGITLLSVPSNILARTILNRIQAKTEA